MNEITYKEQIEREIEERDKKYRKIDEIYSKLEDEANKYDYWYNVTNDPIWENRMKMTLNMMEELKDYKNYLEEEIYIDDGIEFDELEGKCEYLIDDENSNDSVDIVEIGSTN